MSIEEKVEFDKEPPSPEMIIHEIRSITGLTGLKWDERKMVLQHELFTRRLFIVSMDEKNVYLMRGWVEQWYLLDAAIVALTNLGGRYEREVPELGSKKWIDVKDKYPEVKPWQEMQ